jgi:stearoyl-CoA desaturase (delta-9 desaturase)
MTTAVLSFFADGFVPLPWWGYVVVTLALTHVTIAGVTIYLHRHQAHRALDLHPLVSHFFRFWLWLTTGMVTREWAAIHRKHHAKVETSDDPHSPQTRGINKVLWEGVELYRAEAANRETIERYGKGTPDDWIERHLYSRFPTLGVALMLVIDVLAFGAIGLSIWAIQMVWIPFFAAGIINGLGHYWGYRNFACEDSSTNIVPWGILIGGEELHNNHHAYGSSAKLSSKWYEFDIGWLYIRILETLRLASVRKVAPRLRIEQGKDAIDLATLHAVITHRYAVVTQYARSLRATCAAELAHLHERARRGDPAVNRRALRRFKRWLLLDDRALPEAERIPLEQAFESSKALQTVYYMRQELAALWERSTESSEQLLHRLQDWCHRAESSDIGELVNFSRRLRQMAA